VVLSLQGCLTCIDYSCKGCTLIGSIFVVFLTWNSKYRTVKYKVTCCFLKLIYIAGHESWRSSELDQSFAGTCIKQGHATLQAAILIGCYGNVSLPACLKWSVETCCDDGLYLGINLWSELLCSLGLLFEQLWSNQEGIQTGIVAWYEVAA
jgi:hypothetical protein